MCREFDSFDGNEAMSMEDRAVMIGKRIGQWAQEQEVGDPNRGTLTDTVGQGGIQIDIQK